MIRRNAQCARRARTRAYRQMGDPRHFAAAGITALWDPAKGITLNGTNVSAIASQVPGAVNLTQATGGLQPLYIGAPTYNGSPSIKFTNSTSLGATNIDVLGGTGYTAITAQRPPIVPITQTTSTFENLTGSTGVQMAITSANPGVRQITNPGVSVRTDGNASTAGAEVWVFTQSSSACNLVVNGTDVGISSGGYGAPGGTASITVGRGELEWLYGVTYSTILAAGPIFRIRRYMGARIGVAA